MPGAVAATERKKSRPCGRLFFCLSVLLFGNAASAVASGSLHVRVTCIADQLLVEYHDQELRDSVARQTVPMTKRAGAMSISSMDDAVAIPVRRPVRVSISTMHETGSWWRTIVGFGCYPLPYPLKSERVFFRSPEARWFRLPTACRPGSPDSGFALRARGDNEFNEWLEGRKNGSGFPADQAKEQFLGTGRAVCRRRCAPCHGEAGEGADLFPRLAGNAFILGPLAPYLRTIVAGRPGTPMKAFGDVLDANELAALMTYQRNAWGHESGDVIQPAVVRVLLQTLRGDADG